MMYMLKSNLAVKTQILMRIMNINRENNNKIRLNYKDINYIPQNQGNNNQVYLQIQKLSTIPFNIKILKYKIHNS